MTPNEEQNVRKHTKGPWEVNGCSQIVSKAVPFVRYGEKREYERYFIVCHPDLYVDAKDEELRANVELIAKAPEMAEELSRLRALNAQLLEALNGINYNMPRINCDMMRHKKNEYHALSEPCKAVERWEKAVEKMHVALAAAKKGVK